MKAPTYKYVPLYNKMFYSSYLTKIYQHNYFKMLKQQKVTNDNNKKKEPPKSLRSYNKSVQRWEDINCF